MFLKECPDCEVRLVPSQYLRSRTVAGRCFEQLLPSEVCPQCGREFVGIDTAQEFELSVAEQLAREGPPTGEAFRYMRKALGMSAVEAARLLGVKPETISRWEKGRRTANPALVVLMGTIVLESLKGERTTADRLHSLVAA
jgi:putative zinc finger/helix-turn-helix YgiT family protein